MITIVVAQDENKIRDMLAQLLKREGYNISTHSSADTSAINILSKDHDKNSGTLKDKVIELGNYLFKEKRGDVYKTILDEIEKPLIESALECTDGNQLKAAKILGINRNTIRSKIKKLCIDPKQWKSQ